jgi:hypothetical protein
MHVSYEAKAFLVRFQGNQALPERTSRRGQQTRRACLLGFPLINVGSVCLHRLHSFWFLFLPARGGSTSSGPVGSLMPCSASILPFSSWRTRIWDSAQRTTWEFTVQSAWRWTIWLLWRGKHSLINHQLTIIVILTFCGCAGTGEGRRGETRCKGYKGCDTFLRPLETEGALEGCHRLLCWVLYFAVTVIWSDRVLQLSEKGLCLLGLGFRV